MSFPNISTPFFLSLRTRVHIIQSQKFSTRACMRRGRKSQEENELEVGNASVHGLYVKQKLEDIK